MTRRERVLTSLRHRQPDRCPHHISFTQPAREILAAHVGEENLERELDNHLAIAGVGPPGAWREVAADIWEDEFGVRWDRTVDRDIGTVTGCVLSEPRLAGYSFPDPDDPARFAALPQFIEQSRDLFVMVSIGFSLFERAWTLRGMENLFLDMIEHPDFVEELLDAILDFNLAIIGNAMEFEVDAMRFGDDWGQQRGLLMGAPFWRRFLKPRLARMYGAVRDAGKVVCIHSCGDVTEVFPDLVEIGVEIFNPFQPEVMDVGWMKQTYGDRMTFYGGISLQQTLPHGTPGDVRAEVRDRIASVGENGGYILSPSHDVTRDVPVANMMAMIQAIREQ